MKVVNSSGAGTILRLKKGEEYPAVLSIFLKQKKIKGGFFFGLGGFIDPEIAFYDLKNKKYLKKKLKGTFEVLSLVGNVATFGKEIVIHEHVYLSGRNYKAIGGHLVKAWVGGTLEIFFSKTGELRRKFDKRLGLNLL